ncbi:hypothetical protein RRG08_044242 [Elysia crispata]|uniref:Uncharacterized protein n=1 Tax=Elysia crispata TaxID=231223 RepID=A0AAE0XWZ2_9GAST|nr:hypothetical protein RRG08_044242 [Elysia crispata]
MVTTLRPDLDLGHCVFTRQEITMDFSSLEFTRLVVNQWTLCLHEAGDHHGLLISRVHEIGCKPMVTILRPDLGLGDCGFFQTGDQHEILIS